MRVLKDQKISILLFTLIFATTLSNSTDADAIVTPPLTKCHIEIDDPHISGNLIHTRGILAVKVNARSKCNKPMRDLVLTVEIYKIGFFEDLKVADEKETKQGLIFANKVIKNEKTYFKCKNSKLSKYYGIAFAAATIGGKLVKTFRVITEKTVALKCGN